MGKIYLISQIDLVDNAMSRNLESTRDHWRCLDRAD